MFEIFLGISDSGQRMCVGDITQKCIRIKYCSERGTFLEVPQQPILEHLGGMVSISTLQRVERGELRL